MTVYYKMWQKLSKNAGGFLLQNATVIAKCHNYYKLPQLYYKMQHHKMQYLLQIATVQTFYRINRIFKHWIMFTILFVMTIKKETEKAWLSLIRKDFIEWFLHIISAKDFCILSNNEDS